MVWSEESSAGYVATCRTTQIASGTTVPLKIAVSGDDPPQGGDVSVLLVPLGETATPSSTGTMPEGTVRAGKVEQTGAVGSAIQYTATFAVPPGLAGDYQLVIDWRRSATDGEYIVVGNDDPRSIFHVGPSLA